jgi:hypothetical protein
MSIPDSTLLARWPSIPWHEPIAVNGRFACRICIARNGLKGTEIGKLPLTAEEIIDHIAVEHPGVIARH